ncbi:toxin-antitoxin system, toxin component [Streptomyces ureilyticus]|uniref:Toxin-antitoxin system, toxin component n=1 Tax=Streptomyces ureilyticus TaxID=1775131 RepID=A0ABX0DZ48_9ACTN|nr:toxin-antitoxin system, toxin component [Streptomyces ureilyticus]NGO47218.1 toxin-antitoxin system, toxin component [Streptomyces ureilyticus]
METLSAQLIAGVAQMAPGDDDGILTALSQVLGAMRGRPVILKREDFPLDSVSGLWLDMADMDIIAVRRDAVDSQHELVILGHEIWHMTQGHCTAHTKAGPAAARGHSSTAGAVDHVVARLLASPDGQLGDLSPRELHYAARTDFHAEDEAEAELFGLKLATAMREHRRIHRRPDLRHVAGRIENSLGRGPWA